MSYTPISKAPVGNNEYFIDLNHNTSAGFANVIAFLACFAPYISSVSAQLNGMPRNFILGLLGLESRWDCEKLQYRLQNWANISYTDANHPAGNIGKDDKTPFAKFPGIYAFCRGFVSFFKDRSDPSSADSQTYKKMLSYCASTSSPSYSVLADYLVEAHYNTESGFKSNLLGCCNLVDQYIGQVWPSKVPA